MSGNAAYAPRLTSCASDVQPGRMYLWTTRHDANGSTRTDDALLSIEERRRARRFHRLADHNQFVVAHSLLRLVLSCPGEWRFSRDRNGRPHIMAPALLPEVYFNLSHTAGFAACLISLTPEAAVDVERIAPDEQLVC
jgi:phosphopantetheinyl transferase